MKTDRAPEGRSIERRTDESRVMVTNVERAMRLAFAINQLSYDDGDEVRRLFSELTGQVVDASFRLIPPVYTDHGVNLRVGRNVFINQCCSLNDIGGIDIADDVMIGPKVNLITSGHPVDPSERYARVVAKPISIQRNVWIGAAATILPGVTIGENSMIAAGAVVTRSVPANAMVAGIPAKVVRRLA